MLLSNFRNSFVEGISLKKNLCDLPCCHIRCCPSVCEKAMFIASPNLQHILRVKRKAISLMTNMQSEEAFKISYELVTQGFVSEKRFDAFALNHLASPKSG
jgi:hypothetical protein